MLNPATGEVIDEVPASDAADVDAAVAAAAAAFAAWRAMTPRARSEALYAVADAIEDDLDTIKRLEMRERAASPPRSSSSRWTSRSTTGASSPAGARFLEGRAAGEYIEEHTSFLRRDPLGVVGSIAPWNYPLNMATWKLGPALAAGNTVVLKPSELTPLTALRLAEITADILPPGVLNVVTGQGETAGDALVRHPDVAMVSLTGDVATGKLIARTAAETLKRVHLELGGKAPVIVFDDADVEAVGRDASPRPAYYNSGQDCTAPCRVIAGPERVRRPRERRSPSASAASRPATRSTRTPRWARSSRPTSSSGSAAWSTARVEAGAEVTIGGAALDGAGLLLRAVGRGRTRPRTPRSSSARSSARS